MRRKKFKYSLITGIACLAALIANPDILRGYQSDSNGELASNGKSSIEINEYAEYNVETLPSSLLKIDTNKSTVNMVVDKKEQKLYIYKQDKNGIHLVKVISCTTGKNSGVKIREGDEKTPEGIYFLIDKMESEDIVRMYGKWEAAQFGIRAFDSNYPNIYDRMNKRTGSGIWLHGTDQPERTDLPNSSRGCIVMRNSDVQYVTPFLELNKTPLVIMNHVEFKPIAEINAERDRILQRINQWRQAWQSRDIELYGTFYSDDFKTKGRTKERWLAYKKLVLSSYNYIDIQLSDIRIIEAEDYLYIDFYQNFMTDTYGDVGLKELYMTKTSGNYFILSEEWVANQ